MKLIQQAQRLWVDEPNRPVFLVGDAENLPLNNDSCDVCFFGGVLHHFPVRSAVLQEAFRILKEGGKLVAVEPNLLDFLERIEWFVAGVRKKLTPNEYPISPIAFQQELVSTGFSQIEIFTIRHDIPFLAQFPILKHFFSRQKGFKMKKPILAVINQFRSDWQKGTFFVVKGVKSL